MPIVVLLCLNDARNKGLENIFLLLIFKVHYLVAKMTLSFTPISGILHSTPHVFSFLGHSAEMFRTFFSEAYTVHLNNVCA
jgi:hypothetical protein